MAYPLIYQRIVRDLDADRRLEIDGILGDPTAKAELQSRRRDAILAADIEVG